MFCKAFAGSLELLDDCLVIKRSGIDGFLQHGLVGEKRIPYSSITAVQLKRAGVLAGYIQFTIPGGVESTKGMWAAAKGDENTLLFKDNEVFEKARDVIEKKIKESRSPHIVMREMSSSADQLDKLASLLERGLLTIEEFNEQKRSLIGSPSSPPAEPEIHETSLSSEGHRMQDAMDRAIASSQQVSFAGATTANSSAPSFGKRNAKSLW